MHLTRNGPQKGAQTKDRASFGLSRRLGTRVKRGEVLKTSPSPQNQHKRRKLQRGQTMRYSKDWCLEATKQLWEQFGGGNGQVHQPDGSRWQLWSDCCPIQHGLGHSGPPFAPSGRGTPVYGLHRVNERTGSTPPTFHYFSTSMGTLEARKIWNSPGSSYWTEKTGFWQSSLCR